MPPGIRARATKASKENIGGKEKSKPKSTSKIPRKVLGDKTNSASDENVSVEVPIKSKQTVTQALEHEVKKSVRPRRDRRLPTRYVENKVLTNLSNSRDGPVSPIPVNVISPVKINGTSSKSDEPQSSPFKTPSKVESSLVANRPKRICRLPSRFDDHSISPNKYIPIKPSNASTPIQLSKAKTNKNNNAKGNEDELQLLTKSSGVNKKPALHTQPTRSAKNAALQKKLHDSSATNSSPDTNNNPKGRTLRAKKTILSSLPKKNSPDKAIVSKKLRDKSMSFKVFEDKKKKAECNKSNLDVYEFTYDPNEEPKPKKKKRKNVAKKPSKPKTVKFNNNYDQNINKALATLRSAVAKNNPTQTAETVKSNQENVNLVVANSNMPSNSKKTIMEKKTNVVMEENGLSNETAKTSVKVANYPSIRIEDIAADIEPSIQHDDDINYSPVNSPNRSKSPALTRKASPERPIHVNDPLNLQEDFSFFDEQPVASSSMNQSVRNPLASPWRVEFGSLPIKWPVNTYVKPNMTPAVESSFISSSDSIKKRHVYTNIMVPQACDVLPEIATNNSNWKQTSIISFIKEVAERNLKKKKVKSLSPTKYSSLFEDVPKSTKVDIHKTSKKHTKKGTGDKDITPEENDIDKLANERNDNSEDKENSTELIKETRKRKNVEAINDIPAKSPRKPKNKDGTYFGFDDSENLGQENVSPIKDNNPGKRTLRSGARPALQAMNLQAGPMRATLPAAKTKIALSSEVVNRVYETHKLAADAPAFPEKESNFEKNNFTNIDDEILNDDDSQSVHLFEDIEVVHHHKPTRKSYGKPKRVAFRQRSSSGSDSPVSDIIARNESSGEDDLADLSFQLPNVKEKKVKKKKKPKKLMSKKEEREADEWAASFNSMCEDIEEFPLIVE